jgi:hypothetical protein
MMYREVLAKQKAVTSKINTPRENTVRIRQTSNSNNTSAQSKLDKEAFARARKTGRPEDVAATLIIKKSKG